MIRPNSLIISFHFLFSCSICPALTGCKPPTSTRQKKRRLADGGSTARKRPIGSTNNQWGMKKTPTD
ncbi:hypothetical protein CD798_05245 [Bacillaceae bacterium SAOS 7]|nr:hypothetical protein CD798_05245 [Bacillaceae bacterium SAOS 7]